MQSIIAYIYKGNILHIPFNNLHLPEQFLKIFLGNYPGTKFFFNSIKSFVECIFLGLLNKSHGFEYLDCLNFCFIEHPCGLFLFLLFFPTHLWLFAWDKFLDMELLGQSMSIFKGFCFEWYSTAKLILRKFVQYIFCTALYENACFPRWKMPFSDFFFPQLMWLVKFGTF